MPNRSWFERVPKVEIHLHLEGAIPLDALWELIAKYGGDPAVADRQALERHFEYRDFSHFLDTWTWKNGYLRDYDDFAMVAEGVAADLATQHVLYAEVFYSPGDFRRHGLQVQRLTEAIRTGLSRVPGIEIALIGDLLRNSTPSEALVTLEQMNEVRDLGVVGVGIGGAEHLHPPEKFAGVYERARRHGLHTTAHAGEAAGPQSIWGAIRALEVERIGHGTSAQEDEALVEHLRETQTPVEMCPISNLRTGAVSSLAEHPIRRFYDRGLLVTVNTDDPKMFGTSLAGEYRALSTELGFCSDEIRSLILNAARSTWLPDSRRAELMRALVGHPDWLG